MRCQLANGSRRVVLSAQERATLSKAFTVVEQGAFHTRKDSDRSYQVAADSLAQILESSEEELGELEDTTDVE